MKKFFLTIAVFMLMGFCCKAQSDMFFHYSEVDNEMYRDNTYDNVNFGLPTAHGLNNDAEAPLGSGMLVLTALGAGYAVVRRGRATRCQN